MFLPRLRAATPADLPELLRMAAAAGPGIGTLRPDPELLTARLHASQQSFATADEEVSGEERYLFVLDDGRGGLLGCSGISACAGYGSRFYAYRNEFVVASSARLAVRTRSHTLQLTHDLTGATLLTSFYLDPAAAPMLGELLSRARLLFIHQFASRFAERVVAEFPGLLDAEGRSPFWDAVGRAFFAMEYAQAEALVSGRSKEFLASLMPQSPLYVPLLPEAAQRAIGQLHPDGALPFAILQAEGFDGERYIDILDGGPTMEATLAALRSVRLARPLPVPTARAERAAGGDPASPGIACIACNTEREGFEARLLPTATAAPWTEGLCVTLESSP
jgi:arginine N-succinyltransferase